MNNDGSYILTPIEDLAEGDLVISRDQFSEGDDTGRHSIVQVFRNVSDHLRIVRVRDANGNVEMVRTTDEHSFYLAWPISPPRPPACKIAAAVPQPWQGGGTIPR